MSIYQASLGGKGSIPSSWFGIQNHVEQMTLQDRAEERVVFCWTGKEAVSTFFKNKKTPNPAIFHTSPVHKREKIGNRNMRVPPVHIIKTKIDAKALLEQRTIPVGSGL